jgi:hypothetical protein
VLAPGLAVQVKYGRVLPTRLREALAQAKQTASLRGAAALKPVVAIEHRSGRGQANIVAVLMDFAIFERLLAEARAAS